jgi:hypothetical protein
MMYPHNSRISAGIDSDAMKAFLFGFLVLESVEETSNPFSRNFLNRVEGMPRKLVPRSDFHPVRRIRVVS